MVKVLMVNPEKCTGCKKCEIACASRKTNEFDPIYSAIKVYSHDEGSVWVPIVCMQCEEAACAKVCPVKAITKDENGAAVINENLCIRCKMCMRVCPFGCMSYNSDRKEMLKCDLCGGNPQCVKVCADEAIEYKEDTKTNLNRKKNIASKLKDTF